MTVAVVIFLWLIVVALGFVAIMRSRALFRSGLKGGAVDFLRLLPRLTIGVLGSGFIAEVMPQALIAQWLGPESGLSGTAVATVAGALTPGGPMIGFAIGIAALKSGASAPQVIAYMTAWALFALHRVFLWEMPMMPARIVWLRVLASIPLPFLAAWIAMLAGKP
ncbi:MAG TPA: hypothetical protein VFQ27_10705 [Xanthobacteraceae bacterium]|nr:hypothetical protein [Xanthobacteraceae bacterium]